MKKTLLLVAANIAIACALILLLELGGQAVYRLKHGRFIFQEAPVGLHQQVFEHHPFLVGRLRKNVSATKWGNTIRATAEHTRWTGAPADDEGLIRVAILGGSTAFGTGVTDEDSWPAILQSELGDGFSVINYGMPGYSTVEGIIQMAILVPEARPHIVILYQGWNDIRNYHSPDAGPDYYGHGMLQYDSLSIPTAGQRSVMDKFNDVFTIVRLARTIRGNAPAVQGVQAGQLFDTPDPFIDRVYVRNLKTLKLLAEQSASLILFVPQVLNDGRYTQDDTSYPWSPYIENSAMPKLMARFNGLMRGVCPEDEPRCEFVGGVTGVDWQPEDFVENFIDDDTQERDNGHFSRQGGEKFTEVLLKVIRQKVKNLAITADGAASATAGPEAAASDL